MPKLHTHKHFYNIALTCTSTSPTLFFFLINLPFFRGFQIRHLQCCEKGENIQLESGESPPQGLGAAPPCWSCRVVSPVNSCGVSTECNQSCQAHGIPPAGIFSVSAVPRGRCSQGFTAPSLSAALQAPSRSLRPGKGTRAELNLQPPALQGENFPCLCQFHTRESWNCRLV